MAWQCLPIYQSIMPSMSTFAFFVATRNQAEMTHTCRGTINLASAFITTADSCTIVISSGGNHTFHLKATSEVDRQKWVTALELAKADAQRMLEPGRHNISFADLPIMIMLYIS